jgi:hypothetical protein
MYCGIISLTMPQYIKGIRKLRVGDVIKSHQALVRLHPAARWYPDEVRKKLNLVKSSGKEWIRIVEIPKFSAVVVGRCGDQDLYRKGYVDVKTQVNGTPYRLALDKYADHPNGAYHVDTLKIKRIADGTGPYLPKGPEKNVIRTIYTKKNKTWKPKVITLDDFLSPADKLSNGDWRQDWRNMAQIRRHYYVHYEVYLASQMAAKADAKRDARKQKRKADQRDLISVPSRTTKRR